MNTYPTFAEYLASVSSNRASNNVADYGLYLEEINKMQRYSHLSSTLFFLIDYATMSYPFMSSNVIDVIGHPRDAYREGGLEFSLHHNQHFNILNKEIYMDRTNFLREIDHGELPQIRFSMGFAYRDARGTSRSILQRHVITELTTNLQPKGIFGFCWDVTDGSPKAEVFHGIEQFNSKTNGWESVLYKKFFPDIEPENLLSEREIEILKWMSDGMHSKQIAEKLHLSKYTVDTHRKNMLKKTNSKNIAELVHFASRLDLI